ncbi:MAG TPA: hypothetical protein VJ997_06400 [Longimicrobiales bacterium]|nr:hypothetical protein [Longimicrobiales bacterium]
MTLQSEVGDFRRPMRPLVAYLECAEDPSPLRTDGAPVDWTHAGTQIDVAITAKAMDEGFPIAVDGTSANVVLPPGQWEVVFHPIIAETGGGAGVFRLAITDSAGTTIHAESVDLDIAANGTAQLTLAAYVHVTADAGEEVVLRAAKTATTCEIALATQLATVRKIGNRNETGQ